MRNGLGANVSFIVDGDDGLTIMKTISYLLVCSVCSLVYRGTYFHQQCTTLPPWIAVSCISYTWNISDGTLYSELYARDHWARYPADNQHTLSRIAWNKDKCIRKE